MARNTVSLPIETVSMVKALALAMLPEALKVEKKFEEARKLGDQKVMPTFFKFAQEAVKISGNTMNGAQERFLAICREAEKTILVKQYGEKGAKDASILEVLPSWGNYKSRVKSSFEAHGDGEDKVDAVNPTKEANAEAWTNKVNTAYSHKTRGARGQNTGRQLPDGLKAEMDILNKSLWKFTDEALAGEVTEMIRALNLQLGKMLEPAAKPAVNPALTAAKAAKAGEGDLPARNVA